MLKSQLEKLLATFGIRHRVTPPYNSQCNPVERANRTFKTMVAQYVGRNQKTWNEHIAALQYAYNTAWHEELGNTPAYLNHSPDHTRKIAGIPRTPRRQMRSTAIAQSLRTRPDPPNTRLPTP